ncbi:phage tail tape measure protein [Azospirillum cavernae]|nr:phage tail tape measure protein [Azospirillum cavernae]
MTDKAKVELRKFGDTASLEAKASLNRFQNTLNQGARSLNQDGLLNDVLGGKFKAANSTAGLKRQIGDLTSLYNSFYDNLGRKREGSSVLENLGGALSQAQTKLKQVADPITATVADARKQVRDLGAELASVVMQSDRKKQTLGARAYEGDALSTVKRGGIGDLSDQQLKLAEKAAARVRETTRGELESLKAQQSSASAIAQKNRELERTATLEAQITAELSRRKSASATPVKSTQEKADASWDMTFARVNSGGGAKLLEMQARLLVNYQAINAALSSFSFGAQFVKELDAEMRNLQAISNTTDTAMQGLRQTLIGVSEDTKFTAVEVTKAATTMSQAGFSTDQIQGAIKGVTLLATATGSDLAQSVDVATSIVGVFNVRAEEMGQVANQVTSALNLSKLTMEKLATGIQYAGNIAADNNVSFTELVTVMGAMSNAGIKNGSTLGTGIRQLMIDLQNPTEKLISGLAKVGLTMADVDVRSKGLIGVLQTLKDAGFTTADAIQTLEVRSAAAYSAAAKFTDGMAEMQRQILLSNAAVEANDIQMKSFENTWKQFTSVFGTFADQIGRGALLALRDLVAGISEVVSAMSRMSAIGTIGDAGIAAAFTAMAMAALNLIKNLTPVRALIGGVGAAMTATAATAVSMATAVKTAGGVSAAFTASLASLRGGLLTAQGATAAFSTAMTGLVAVLSRFIVPAAIFLIAESFISGAREADRYASAIDQAKARVDELNGRVQQQQEAMQSVSKQMDIYQDRSERLKSHQDELSVAVLEAEQKFGKLGFTMDGLEPTFDNMMRALQNLQGKLAEDFTGNLEAQLDALGNKVRTTQLQLQSFGDLNQIGPLLAGIGESDALTVERTAVPKKARTGNFVNDTYEGVMDIVTNPVQRFKADMAALFNDKATLAQLRPDSITGLNTSALKTDLGKQITSHLQQGPNANVNDVNRSIGDIERRIIETRRSGQDTSGLEKLKDTLEKLSTGLVNIRADEQKQKDIKDNQLPAAKFMETVGPALEQQVREYKSLTDSVKRQIDAAGSAREKDKVLKENQPKLEAAKSALMSARGGLAGDQQKVFDKLMGSTMNEVEHVVEGMGDDIADSLDKAEKRVKQERAKRLEAQITRLGRFRKGEDPNQGDVESRIAQVKSVGAELMDAELSALRTQLEGDKDLAGNPEEIEAALNERKMAIQEKIDASVEGLGRLYDGMEKSLTLKTESAMAALKRLDKESKETLEQSTFEAATPTRMRSVTINAKKEMVSRGLANETDIVALEMDQRDDQDKLEETMVGLYKRRADDIAELMRKATEASDAEIRKMEELKAASEDATRGLNARKEAQKEYNETVSEHKTTLNEVTSLTIAHKDALRQVEEQQEKVRAKNDDLSGNWTKAWKANTQKTLETAGAFKTFQDATIALGQTAITEGMSGLSTFISDLASGAKTAGEAFRDMARSFATALLNMASQQAAASVMGALFGNAATGNSGASGAASGASGGIISSLGSWVSSLFYTGGPVRNASGTRLRLSTGSVSGVDVGRDSVDAILRPGEFVMNKSATDAVGEDFLADLNARGAAALPSQMPTMPKPTQPAPVKTNVYVVSPDRAPQMGPSDVVATISNDIATGGSVKQLIKSVVAGRM